MYHPAQYYDGKLKTEKNGMPLFFKTESGRFLCASCVEDNRNTCMDKNSPKWYLISDTTDVQNCGECEERLNDME